MKKTILAGFISISTMAFSQTYDLKLNLEKGKTYELLQNVQTNMLQNAMGQQIPVNITAGVGMKVKVLNKINNEFELETQFSYVSSKAEAMGNKMDANSKKCNEDENSKLLCTLVGKKFTVFLSDKGKVNKIIGNKDILEQVKKEAGTTNELAKDGKIFQMYEEENIKSTFQSLFNFPDKTIKVGDTWTTDSVTNNGFQMENHSVYTLKSADEKGYAISVATDLKTSPNQTMVNKGMKMSPNFKGNSTTNILLNKSTGWLSSSSSTSAITGEISILDMGDMKMDMSMNTKTNILPVSEPVN
jgi:hypothetical protein